MAVDLPEHDHLFQFLMVRLKVLRADSDNRDAHQFQFLMVRLKVRCKGRAIARFVTISIPYGSIKSHDDWFWLLVTTISIPYGSIKRAVDHAVFDADKTFQFLMVRLKALHKILPLKSKSISIPYGSIKRRWPPQDFLCYVKISIPYGSIKRTISNAPEKNLFSFQFLMVRLKVCVQSIRPRAVYISIPYGSIKRHLLHPDASEWFHFNSLWFD